MVYQFILGLAFLLINQSNLLYFPISVYEFAFQSSLLLYSYNDRLLPSSPPSIFQVNTPLSPRNSLRNNFLGQLAIPTHIKHRPATRVSTAAESPWVLAIINLFRLAIITERSLRDIINLGLNNL